MVIAVWPYFFQELENKKAAEAAAVAAALSDDSGSLSCNGATVTEMVEMKNIENSNKSNTAGTYRMFFNQLINNHVW